MLQRHETLIDYWVRRGVWLPSLRHRSSLLTGWYNTKGDTGLESPPPAAKRSPPITLGGLYSLSWLWSCLGDYRPGRPGVLCDNLGQGIGQWVISAASKPTRTFDIRRAVIA